MTATPLRPGNALTTCLALAVLIVLAQATQSAANSGQCKELNQINCYMGKNEGYYCSSKDQTKEHLRWYYDKGTCRRFDYKGCYGNRNRFCTKESCENRCRGQ